MTTRRSEVKLSARLTVPMTPEMMRAIAAESVVRKLTAAEWVRRLIESALGAKGEAA